MADQYKMISTNDLGKSWEDNLVKYLGKSMPSNLYLLERGIRNYSTASHGTLTVPPIQACGCQQ